jgi:hypothetical protein
MPIYAFAERQRELAKMHGKDAKKQKSEADRGQTAEQEDAPSPTETDASVKCFQL